MVALLSALLSLPALAADAEAPTGDVSSVLSSGAKKGKWDPKGKAITPYGKGDAKRKQEAWAEAIPLLVESLDAQPGCGKCLDSLARSLTGAERYAEAAQVGELMARLYPERGEGWARASDAWQDADNLEKVVEATTKYLEVKKDDATFWDRRNAALVALGRVDEANVLLKDASTAGLKKEDIKCLETQNLASEGKTAEARDVWPICAESTNLTLKRISEGWLLLAEGNDPELAITRLSLAGRTNYVQLIQAYVRLDQKKYDSAANLAVRALKESDWALDAHLAHAEAQYGLGHTSEALAVLDQHFTGPGWMDNHGKMPMSQMLLRMRGPTWPEQVARRAEVLKVAVLARQGDYAAAWAMHQDVLKVNGDTPEVQKALQSALDTPVGDTGIGWAQIQKALAENATLRRCQDKAKKPSGIVVVGFTLGANGQVADATVKSRTLTAPDLEKCTLAEVGKLKLAVAQGATATAVVFPVVYPL